MKRSRLYALSLIIIGLKLASSFNSTPGKPNWNPDADFNSDEVVNINDPIMLANRFNQHE